MFVTNWISTTKIQKISEITNFFRHYFYPELRFFLHKRFLMEKNHTSTSLAEPKDLMHSKQFSTFAENFKPLKFH